MSQENINSAQLHAMKIEMCTESKLFNMQQKKMSLRMMKLVQEEGTGKVRMRLI